jgi:hypothetical protein
MRFVVLVLNYGVCLNFYLSLRERNDFLFKECVSDPGVDTECRPERGDNVHREQCVPTPDAVPPSSAASVVTEAGVLPDAIAPSLASTPEFARRNTSWFHAIEVRFCYVVHYNAEQFYATEQFFLLRTCQMPSVFFYRNIRYWWE